MVIYILFKIPKWSIIHAHKLFWKLHSYTVKDMQGTVHISVIQRSVTLERRKKYIMHYLLYYATDKATLQYYKLTH